MSPLARMMIGVSDLLRQLRQYQFINPPIVLAMVKDGVLYMPELVSDISQLLYSASWFRMLARIDLPTATAIPPGTKGVHFAPIEFP
jgi:hypothetical protein